jgi:Spy/CpxP family protein refolding chaperone
MKTLRLILIAALFLAPLVVRAQSNPQTPAPDSGVAPPEAIIARQSLSEATPPPGKPMVNTEVQVVEDPEGQETIIAPTPLAEVTPDHAKTTVNTEVRVIGGPGDLGEGPREFGPVGAWWKNSEIVRQLNLTDEQVKKVSKTFLDHKLQLIDLQADLDKQELRLQPLMDVDQPDASKVGAQIDLITAARGRLEKENAMMMLDIRRWLSVEQWKKLKSLDLANEVKKKVFFFQNLDGPPPAIVPDDAPVRGIPRARPPQ